MTSVFWNLLKWHFCDNWKLNLRTSHLLHPIFVDPKTALDVISEANEVTKQKDMSGFYRHLLNATGTGTDKDKEPAVKEEKMDSIKNEKEKDRWVLISISLS